MVLIPLPEHIHQAAMLDLPHLLRQLINCRIISRMACQAQDVAGSIMQLCLCEAGQAPQQHFQQNL